MNENDSFVLLLITILLIIVIMIIGILIGASLDDGCSLSVNSDGQAQFSVGDGDMQIIVREGETTISSSCTFELAMDNGN